MNKTEMLFIRACKSKDPEKRLFTLYNKKYLKCTKEDSYLYISVLLTDLVHNYNLLSIKELVDKLSTFLYFRQTINSYPERIYYIMRSKIRFAPCTEYQFPVLIKPLRNRK